MTRTRLGFAIAAAVAAVAVLSWVLPRRAGRVAPDPAPRRAPAASVDPGPVPWVGPALGAAPPPVSPGGSGVPGSPSAPGVRGGVLHGVVLDPDDRAVAGARVSGQGLLAGTEKTGPYPYGSVFEACTDDEGRFVLEGPPGRLRLQVLVNPWALAWTDVDLPGRDCVVRLERGRRVDGRVVLPGGIPVPGLKIQDPDTPRSTTTDPGGRFSLGGLRERRVSVSLRLGGDMSSVETHSPRTDGEDLVLSEHFLRIQLLDEDGVDLREAEVHFSAGGRNFGETTYSPGGLLLAVQHGEEAAVTAHAPGRRSGAATVRLEGAARIHDVRIPMPRSQDLSTLRLRILDGEGRAPGSARVTVHRMDGGAILGLRNLLLHPDDDGIVLLHAVPADARRVEVAPEAGGWDPADYRLPTAVSWEPVPGQESFHDAALPTGGRVRLLLRSATGKDLEAGDVRLLGEDGEVEGAVFQDPPGRAGSDTPGEPGVRLLRDPVPPGRYVVAILRSSFEIPIRAGNTGDFSVHASVEVHPGATADAVLQLPGAAPGPPPPPAAVPGR
jgi:hypothetical protein